MNPSDCCTRGKKQESGTLHRRRGGRSDRCELWLSNPRKMTIAGLLGFSALCPPTASIVSPSQQLSCAGEDGCEICGGVADLVEHN